MNLGLKPVKFSWEFEMTDFNKNNDYLQSDLSWLESACQFQAEDPTPVGVNTKNNCVTQKNMSTVDFLNQFSQEGSTFTYSFKQSKEARERMKKSQASRIQREKELGIVRPCSEEKKEKLRLANLGKKSSEETRMKISAKSREQVHSEETKRKMSAAHKGKIVSAETRAKMSISKQARKAAGYVPRPFTAAELEKIGAAHRGKVVSEETRAKLRAFNLGRNKGVPKSPETIARMKEAAKLRWAMTTDRTRVRNPESTAKMKATNLAKKLALQAQVSSC